MTPSKSILRRVGILGSYNGTWHLFKPHLIWGWRSKCGAVRRQFIISKPTLSRDRGGGMRPCQRCKPPPDMVARAEG